MRCSIVALITFCFLIGSVIPASILKGTRTWDCGPADRVVVFKDTFLTPSPVMYPGNVSIATHMQLLEDLPSQNLNVQIELTKLEPERMPVPCINGRGSCIYDVCSELMSNRKDLFCALGACECPLKKKIYSSTGLAYELPRVGGRIFAQILQGNFEGTVTFYNNATNRIYGCLGMELAVMAFDDKKK